MAAGRPRLIYLITEDWFFSSHFIERARAARAAGYDVVIASRYAEGHAWIAQEGFRPVSLNFNRGGVNPFREIATVARIWRLYRQERPALVHQVALKPILYGSMAALLAGVPHIVNAPVGLGFVFTSHHRRARWLLPFVRWSLQLLLNPRGSKTVFENADDLRLFVDGGAVRAGDACLIRGAGVDIDRIRPSPEPEGPLTVLMVARMLADKGVREFVEAARMLRRRDPSMRFLLAGSPDHLNPSSIDEAELRRWHAEEIVEWHGFRGDVAAMLASSHIVALPSYREGLPKALLEAMAAGRPIVTTDVPGCRDAVRDGENGLLVAARDAQALADAIARLAGDKDMRRRMGAAGRSRAEAEFSADSVNRQTLVLYDLLTGRVARA